MINNFPQLYEDELLYSGISRYRKACGIITKKSILKDFYGTERGMMPLWFPFKLNYIASKLPISSKITGEELLFNHTMYPFYTSFFNEEICSEIKESMLNNSNCNIVIKCGFGGSKVSLNRFLKCCPICVKEDVELYGESFWRRTHQTVGVLYCNKHNIPLVDTIIAANDIFNDYCTLDFKYINNDNINYDLEFIDINKIYISNINYIVKENVRRISISQINNFYKRKLINKGLASKNGCIYMKDLLVSFKQFYPQKYLELMQSNYEIEDKSNWLRLFIRNTSKNRSVVRHMLLLQFLNSSSRELFEETNLDDINKTYKVHNPIFDLEKKKEEWLNLLKENPDLPRCELKKIGKGLYSYIHKYDRDWYEKITPRVSRKPKELPLYNEKEDEECLTLVRQAVESIYNKSGRPVRVTETSIRREIGFSRRILNESLILTNNYIKENTETLEKFRIRKIRWAIRELEKDVGSITRYKIQIKAGFGGNCEDEVKKLVDKCLCEM